MHKIKNIAIFGGADIPEESDLYKEVFAVAKLLGEKGYTIVDGGGPGVMLAATQGAVAGGGKTLAVTFDPKNAPGFEGRYVKNQTDQEIKTTNYIDRMYTLMENSDCYVIFKGGTGTISEFGTAWCLARLYYGHHKPFILYGNFWHEIIDVFYKHLQMRNNERDVFKIVGTPEEVIAAIDSFEFEAEQNAKAHFHQDLGEEKAFML
ncbi:hypothetical protein GYA19_04190 [Candidatus Beckwithbacteria bacterium]|nr:hypothetical protein [Candidatus Beckwithbacteria bacterium]